MTKIKVNLSQFCRANSFYNLQRTDLWMLWAGMTYSSPGTKATICA